MKERPILFNTEMIRAILDGRKVQTRRVMKPQPEPCNNDRGGHWVSSKVVQSMVHIEQELMNPSYAGLAGSICPHGDKFDRLWVRETYQGPLVSEDEQSDYYADSDKYRSPRYCEYKADGGPTPEFMTGDDDLVCRWRPSIHMPRWASRINLEIIGIRVERLQDISEDDAIAEGIDLIEHNCFENYLVDKDWIFDGINQRGVHAVEYPIMSYASLWESINGQGSWAANPWVWVIDFKHVIV